MNLLIPFIIIIIVFGLCFYAIDTFITDAKANQIFKFLLYVVIAILVIDALTSHRFSSGLFK